MSTRPRLIKRSPLPILICIAAAAYGQLTRGFISGSVQDASGAVIDGVKITITNTDTGIQRDTVTNADGIYRFVAVEPGYYDIEFVKPGLETRKVPRIQVSTTQEVVVNEALAVSGVATTVEVQEAPPGVDLEKATATIDRKLDSHLVEMIPVNSGTRDITRLALLAPLASRATGQGGISVNGQRPRNTNYVVDGVDNNDVSVTIPNVRMVPEQIAEFHVQSAAYSAEFGHNTGGQIEATTKSGTNQFHGGAWDYYSANWMEPLTLPQKRSGVTDRPRYDQNLAGGDIGGPIIHNRTFFYALVEADRRREAPNADNASSITVPTAAGYALLESLPLGPDQTTQSRQAALNALKFLPDIYPQLHFSSFQNTTVNGVQIPTGTGRIPLPNPFNYWDIVNRVDHQLKSNDSLSYRGLYDKRAQPDVSSNLGFGEKFAAGQAILGQSHAISETHIFSPALINEFRAAFARRNLAFPENDPKTSTAAITGAFTIGGLSNFPQGRVQSQFQYQDIATYLKGRHSLKLGLDFRRIRLFDLNGFNTKGTWAFDTLADFLNNRASQLTQAVSTASVDYRMNEVYPFFQDDFKVSKDLTVNVGLRWEYTSFPRGLLGAREPETLAVGVPGPVSAPKNNWAPRVGFAYSPSAKDGLAHSLFGDGQTVIRGGFGMFYDGVFFNLLSISETQYPRIVNDNRFFPDTLNLYPTLLPPTTTKPVLDPLNAFFNAAPGLRNPASATYSLSIQRAFSKNYIVEVGYSGNHGYHGILQGELNPSTVTQAQANAVISAGNINVIPGTQARRLNPAWGARSVYESSANSEYNAGFVRFDKKMTHNLLVGANYSFSKLLSTNDESLAVTNLADSSPPVPQDYLNRHPEWGLSAFDRPQRFVVYYDYTTPWFTGGSRILKQVFKDWEIAGSSEWQSGQPFTIRTGVDSVGNGRTDSARPFFNPGGTLTLDPVTGDFRTFTTPLVSGRFVTPLTPAGLPLPASEPTGGNLGRNTFRGPGLTQWNVSFSKRFSITERFKLQLRCDALNLFNHRNFGNPENRLVAPTFGQNTRNQIDTFGRSMLLSAHVAF
jgi:hypothetical protein